MSDYSDKSFKDLYAEVIDYVKTLTTKWDPSIADEADPGVAILKASCLLFDKINYRINYRNSQNSVREVTDLIEGENLFYDLGYQMKKKRSASGQISLKYLNSGELDLVEIPLFTQFSDLNNSITYTSIRKMVTIRRGESSLIEVQEGIPVRYEYLGRRVFTDDDLTGNLRLRLVGYEGLSSNSVIICSCSEKEFREGKEELPLVSDWLNTGENIFTAVETDNLYSIGRDPDGVNYVQFYEESLKGLSGGIKIWIISSYGSAGNIPSNRLSTLYSSEGKGLDPTKFVISHNSFTNGQDGESLSKAMENYYKTFGVNNSLVSGRDYSSAIENIIGPNLSRLISKALVSDVSGNHNLVQVLSKLSNGNSSLFVRYFTETLVSGILINALKYSDDYYESFSVLEDDNTLNLIKKALFQENVLSNEISLVNTNIYNKYLFDLANISISVVANTTETEDSLKSKIKEVLSKSFNSRNLTPGKMIPEVEISKTIKEGVLGIVDCSVYYKSHKLLKDIKDSSSLSNDDKIDLVARSVLKGDLPLFSNSGLQVPLGAHPVVTGSSIIDFENIGEEVGPGQEAVVDPSDGLYTFPADPSKNIFELSGKFSPGGVYSTSGYSLRNNEFIQFYTLSKKDSKTYGFGVKALLLTNQKTVDIESGLTLQGSGKVDEFTILAKNSVIAKGSVIYSLPEDSWELEGREYRGISSDLVYDPESKVMEVLDSGIIDAENTIKNSNPGQKPFIKIYRTEGGQTKPTGYVISSTNYKVIDYIAMWSNSSRPSLLAKESIIFDGSYLEGKYHHQLSIENGEIVNLRDYPEARLWLKIGEGDRDYIELSSSNSSEPTSFRVENFRDGFNSSGTIEEHPDWSTLTGFVSETLVTLTDDITSLKVSDGLKYGLVANHSLDSNGKNSFLAGKTEYLLGEGEHLIYSDSDLLDFVDFGSGTLIKSERGLSSLSNLISLEGDLPSKLTDLPIPLEIINTEIYTFSGSGDTESPVKIRYDLPANVTLDLSNDWIKIPASSKIFVEIGGVEQKFDVNYFSRIGLILQSSKEGILSLKPGQELKVLYTDKSYTEITQSFSAPIVYLSSSNPIYLNSATNTDLSQLNLKLKLYGLAEESNNNFDGNITYTDRGGFTLSKTVKDPGTANFVLKQNKTSHLLKVLFNSVEPEARLSINSGATEDSPGGKVFTQDAINLVNILSLDHGEILPGDSVYVYIPAKSSISSIRFLVSNANKGDSVSIESQVSLEGFNKDLFFEDSLDSPVTNDPSQRFESDEGGNILTRVKELSIGQKRENNPPIKFNYEFIGESQLKNPTEVIKYYDEQHILNKNILTVLNLNELDIKISRRVKW